MVRQLGSVISQCHPITAGKNKAMDFNRNMSSFGGPCKSPGYFALFEAIRFKRHRQALLLLEAGVDVDCRNSNGISPLIYTVLNVDDARSRVKLTKLLLDCGADPNLSDWEGQTALMYASARGQVESVKHLLENKLTNAAVKDPDGNTALMHAARCGNVDVISVFISTFRHDLNLLRLNHKNNLGQTALQIAVSNGHDECARLLTREAQLFPNAINEFPDPKVLEREPTPNEARGGNHTLNNFTNLYSTEKLVHIEEFSCEPSYKDVSTNTMQILSQTDPTTDEIDSKNGIETATQETKSKSEDPCLCERSSCHPQLNTTKLKTDHRHKSTQTTITKPPNHRSRPKTTKTGFMLEPLHNLENSMPVYTRLQTMASEYEIQRPKLPTAFSLPEPCMKHPVYLDSFVGQCNKEVRQAGNEKCSKCRRPESEPSVLPIIPCSPPLPPVKKSFASSAAKKCCLRKNNAPLFTTDRISREVDVFKNNVFVRSS